MPISIMVLLLIAYIGNEPVVARLIAGNSLIVGNWRSNDDSKWELRFTMNYRCYQFYGGKRDEVDSWAISNTSPQCGVTVPVDSTTKYLQLTDNGNPPTSTCYEIVGLTATSLTLRVVDRGGFMIFTKIQ